MGISRCINTSLSSLLVLFHRQTVCHLPQPHPLLHDYWVSSSLQIADPAVIAARCGVTTVGDFRVADIALGGQGAPLVPYLDKIILKKHYQLAASLTHSHCEVFVTLFFPQENREGGYAAKCWWDQQCHSSTASLPETHWV